MVAKPNLNASLTSPEMEVPAELNKPFSSSMASERISCSAPANAKRPLRTRSTFGGRALIKDEHRCDGPPVTGE
jgi:hypothetical protein